MTDPQRERTAQFEDLLAARGLTPDESADLMSLIHAARKQERDELDVAIGKVIKSLPVLVRGPAKKIMFGGSSDG